MFGNKNRSVWFGRTHERKYFSYRRVVTVLQDGTELLCDGPLSFRGILDKPLEPQTADGRWTVNIYTEDMQLHPNTGEKNDPMVKPDKQTCGSGLFGWRLNSSSFQKTAAKNGAVSASFWMTPANRRKCTLHPGCIFTWTHNDTTASFQRLSGFRMEPHPRGGS